MRLLLALILFFNLDAAALEVSAIGQYYEIEYCNQVHVVKIPRETEANQATCLILAYIARNNKTSCSVPVCDNLKK